MKKLLVAFLLLIPTLAQAQYNGPGDVVASPWTFWGLRGVTNAFTGNVASICDAATGATCADATWSGGVLTLPTIGGNACDNNAHPCVVATLYDQVGTGCTGGTACDLTQSTNSKRPLLILHCLGSNPCILFDGVDDTLGHSTADISFSQPFTFSLVFDNTETTTGTNVVGLSVVDIEVTHSATNSILGYAGSSVTNTSSPVRLPHSVQIVFNNASSGVSVDGSTTSGTAGTGAPTADRLWLGTFDGGSFPWKGTAMEFGIWTSAFTGTNITNMTANQRAYWGF